MNFKIAEKAAVLRMFKLGLHAPEITRKILDTRSCGGYVETLLEIERILRENGLTEVGELSEVEKATIRSWRQKVDLSNYDIATGIILARYRLEYSRILRELEDE